MDNITDIPEVHSSNRQFNNRGLVKVTQLDPKSMSGEDMNALWQRVATQDYAFDDNTRGNPQAFVLNLVAPASLHFTVERAAYVIARNVFRESNVDLHVIIWDRSFPFKDVIEAGRQILETLFKEQGVARVTGYVPKFNPLACRFATTMGFKYEGTMRKAVKYHEEFFDIDLYGLLPKEFERRFQQ